MAESVSVHPNVYYNFSSAEIGGNMGWAYFNDRLAVILTMTILSVWIANRWLQIPSEVNGALIVVFTLVAQFYFRKKSGGD